MCITIYTNPISPIVVLDTTAPAPATSIVQDINTTTPTTATSTVPATHHTDNEHAAADILLSLQDRPIIATTIAVLDTATPSHIDTTISSLDTTMYGADEYEPSPEDFERRVHVNLSPSASEGPIKAVTATPTNAIFEMAEWAGRREGEASNVKYGGALIVQGKRKRCPITGNRASIQNQWGDDAELVSHDNYTIPELRQRRGDVPPAPQPTASRPKKGLILNPPFPPQRQFTPPLQRQRQRQRQQRQPAPASKAAPRRKPPEEEPEEEEIVGKMGQGIKKAAQGLPSPPPSATLPRAEKAKTTTKSGRVSKPTRRLG
ncbi:MAG: hypothetical protein Q9221_003015 [Calogaya cf. arnoldii]